MFNWSLHFLSNFLTSDGIVQPMGLAGLVVASLNMLIQVFLSVAFGDKSLFIALTYLQAESVLPLP